MQTEASVISKIEDRRSELQNWILHHALQCISEEKQRVEGSEERAYWAHGYMTALSDVLQLFARDRTRPGDGNLGRDSLRRAA